MVDLMMVDVLAATKNVVAAQGQVILVSVLKSCGDYLWDLSLAGSFSYLGTKDR